MAFEDALPTPANVTATWCGELGEAVLGSRPRKMEGWMVTHGEAPVLAETCHTVIRYHRLTFSLGVPLPSVFSVLAKKYREKKKSKISEFKVSQRRGSTKLETDLYRLFLSMGNACPVLAKGLVGKPDVTPPHPWIACSGRSPVTRANEKLGHIVGAEATATEHSVPLRPGPKAVPC